MNITILPLDDRPVNYDYLQMLAAVADVQVSLPPRGWLGNPWRAARHAELVSWLKESAASADAVIVAADTLAYGGLIPSRSAPDSFEMVSEKLGLLSELKKNHPGLPILASSVIQRVSRANSAEEEKSYWAEFGSRMFRLSMLEHKSALNEASAEEITECGRLKAEIPAEIYADYASIRARNHQVNRLMLDLAKKGVVDYLLLPQDDTADYGWNIAEARQLQMIIRREGLTHCAITYPGADEIGCLLLARLICTQHGFVPRIYPRFSSSSSAPIITEYEDRPMLELVKAHLAPLNGIVVESSETADIQLFINAPAIKQGVGELQWAAQYTTDELLQKVPPALKGYVDSLAADPYFQMTRREMQTPRRSPEEFCRAILAAVRSGKRVAVADVAFVNGSDLILGSQLVQHPEIARLAAYGGWNTAGNTLGTVLAQACIFAAQRGKGLRPEQLMAHLEFLFLRFLDDYCYQALERTLCMMEDLPAAGLHPGEERLPDGDIARSIERCVARRLQDQARMLENRFQEAGLVSAVDVSDIYLPWQRLFEIGCTIHATRKS
ncbi:MAG TPA: DUF4127 family protein [Anaerolineaceae bacterium]|nr:DUF4127 family protein [Anaerolineaceae bacterium]HPN53613.1 DUF4127 family protein [Anaerolineaceae bacterium]